MSEINSFHIYGRQLTLDLYQLRTFFTAAQTLNFTEAAGRLYITQSAVSHAIRKLERSAGEELLRKSGRRVCLTEAGKILYKACETVFYELEKAQETLKAARGRNTGNIRLGATVEFGTTLLIKHLAAFIKKNPQIHLDFQFGHELLRPLLNDEVDLIIDCRDHKTAGLEKTPLFREEYAVIASPGLAAGIRRPADLSGRAILSLDKDCAWWKNFLDALPQAGRPAFSRVTELNHIRGIINAAIESLGVGFVPKYCVMKELKAGALKNVFPHLELLEDRFAVYQKSKRAGLERHRLLVQYLSGIKTGSLLSGR
jgi:DNA-binding transcriptional LysR family regulator